MSPHRRWVSHSNVRLSLRPKWQPNSEQNSCSGCSNPFDFWRNRKHHCRACGTIVCNACSDYFDTLPDLGYLKPVRVCIMCRKQGRNRSSTDVSSTTSIESSSSPINSCLTPHAQMEEQHLIQALEILYRSMTKTNPNGFTLLEGALCLMELEIMLSLEDALYSIEEMEDCNFITLHIKSKDERLVHDMYIFCDCVVKMFQQRPQRKLIKNRSLKCLNCRITYMPRVTQTKECCSIDCSTNLSLYRSDTERAQALCT